MFFSAELTLVTYVLCWVPRCNYIIFPDMAGSRALYEYSTRDRDGVFLQHPGNACAEMLQALEQFSIQEDVEVRLTKAVPVHGLALQAERVPFCTCKHREGCEIGVLYTVVCN